MRKLLAIILLAALAGCGTMKSQNSADDSNTANTIPVNNSSFTSDLQNFLGKEDANRNVEQGFQNFVVSGCLGSTAAGLTHTLTACTAYNAGLRGTCGVGNANGLPVSGRGSPDCASNSITYPNNSTCWVAMDENTDGANAGLPNFARVAGTHYLTDCADAVQPAMASDSQLLMQVVTSGGAITSVTDKRNTNGPIGGASVIGAIAGQAIRPNSITGMGSKPKISGFSTDYLYNLKRDGALCDNQQINNGAISSGLKVLTSASNKFVPGDVGKLVAVAGAGGSVTVGGDTFNATLISTIASYQSAGQVTLADAASNTVTTAVVNWGTDDKPKIDTVMADWMATGGILQLPIGACAYNGQFTVATNYASILQGAGQARPNSNNQVGSQIVLYGGTTAASLGAGGQSLVAAAQNLIERDFSYVSANAAADTVFNVSSGSALGLVWLHDIGIGGATDGHEIGLFLGNVDDATIGAQVNYFGGLRNAVFKNAGFLNDVAFLGPQSTVKLATGDTANFQFDIEGALQAVTFGPAIAFEFGPNFLKLGSGSSSQALTVIGDWQGDNLPSACTNWAPSTAYTAGQCVLPLATRTITTNLDLTGTALTSHDGSNIFTQADIGRIVIVNGAGATGAGSSLTTTISAVGATPSNAATLAAPAGTNVTSATGIIIGGYNNHIYEAATGFTSAANEPTWCTNAAKCTTADTGTWNETGPGAQMLLNGHGVNVIGNYITAINGAGILDQSVGANIRGNGIGGGTNAAVGIALQGTGESAANNTFDNFNTGSDEIRVGSTTSVSIGGRRAHLEANGHRNDTNVNNNYSFLPSSTGDLDQPDTTGNAKITNRTGANADGKPGTWNECLDGTCSTGYMQQFSANGTSTLAAMRMPEVKFANCPIACNASNAGAFCSVSDDNTACAFGATVVGGGTHHVLARCNGTNYVMDDCQ